MIALCIVHCDKVCFPTLQILLDGSSWPPPFTSSSLYQSISCGSLLPSRPDDKLIAKHFSSPVKLFNSMGKLVKNHWGRLIVMTAATCTLVLKPQSDLEPSSLTNTSHRPNCRKHRRLLLAQTLLRLSNQKPRRRRKTHPDPANPKPRLRNHQSGVRMAPGNPSRHRNPPVHGTPSPLAASRKLIRHPALPRHESGILLCHRVRSLFLGVC